MTTLEAEPETTVWLEEVPSHLSYEGEQWRVVDMPVRVRVVPDSAYALTHIPPGLPGWRFRAKSEVTAADKVFEVVQLAHAGWQVMRVIG